MRNVLSDNRPEFTAKTLRKWLNQMGVKTLFIETASPWESGYKMRDELFVREIFATLEEAKISIE
jgi:putative transposase